MNAIARALLAATLVATVNATYTEVSTFDALQTAVLGKATQIQIEVTDNINWTSAVVVDEGKNVTIRGGSNGPDRITLDAGGINNKFFVIENGGTLTISKLVLSNGYNYVVFGDGGGGAVDNRGTFKATDCKFRGNTADYEGGAVFNTGTFTSTNCEFSGNTALYNDLFYNGGGAVYNQGNFTSIDCKFSGNTAGGGEGGAVNNEGTFNSTNCEFSGNTAGEGGAVYNEGTFTSINSEFSENTAELGGDDVYNLGGTCSPTLLCKPASV